MAQDQSSGVHAAEGAALGFWYQSFYALLTLVTLTTDDAAIGIEQLDDVELKADGQTLLFQLKHSISANPATITIKSRSLWRTVKVWIDALPALTLAETTLHLVAVGDIPADCPLGFSTSLTDATSARAPLRCASPGDAAAPRPFVRRAAVHWTPCSSASPLRHGRGYS